jgi:hypothetical protein
MREENEEPTFYHYLRATLGDDEKIRCACLSILTMRRLGVPA